ncbi:hypothetical protein YC2023_060527 [Brassica napus]
MIDGRWSTASRDQRLRLRVSGNNKNQPEARPEIPPETRLEISPEAHPKIPPEKFTNHDRRRKGMKKRKRSDESRSHGEEEMVGVERFDELWIQQTRESEDARDLIALFQQNR